MYKLIKNITVLILVTLYSCSTQPSLINSSNNKLSTGKIYLYGETHGIAKISEKELSLWGEFYNKGMRHLFLELPYYSAEFLNIWMKTDNNKILFEFYNDLKGTPSFTESTLDFYKTIKKEYPETIFHGTDVGHQYDSTGERYLNYLSNKNLENSEKYSLTLEAIEQGKEFYKNRHWDYRENKMANNFIREFNNLEDKDIMGIYGSAHTGIKNLDPSEKVPAMANQLYKIYGDQITTTSLTYLAKDIDPIRSDKFEINGKEYIALYFGRQSLVGFKDFEYRDFWRLENAYTDFENSNKTGQVLPYNNFPMIIDLSQVFVVDYKTTDGTITRYYYRSDGKVWNNRPSTEEFLVN